MTSPQLPLQTVAPPQRSGRQLRIPPLDNRDEQVVRRNALSHVVANLAVLRYVLIPAALGFVVLLDDEIDRDRGMWWLGGTTIATAMMVAAVSLPRHRREPLRGTPWTTLTALAFGCTGMVLGYCSWLVTDARVEVQLLAVLVPTLATSIGVVATAGRFDLFCSYAVPMTAVSSAGLWFSGDPELRGIAVLLWGFLAGMCALHIEVSRSLLASLRLQQASIRLSANLADEQDRLSQLNEQLTSTNSQLDHIARHDALTGLYNRRGTLEALEQVLADAAGRSVGLLFIDLDRFKAVNDQLGHRGGDLFLATLAERIGQSLNYGAIPGRIGGDEFVVVLPDSDIADAVVVADRIITALAKPVMAEGRPMPSSGSVGVAAAPRHGSTSSDLLRSANTALYRAKNSGRNQVVVFDGQMQSELDHQMEIETSLRQAVDNGEILPFLQPEIDATTGRVIGAELLARWMRPGGRIVEAYEFIDTAKRLGLLDRLTDEMLVRSQPGIQQLIARGLPAGFRFRVDLGPGSTGLLHGGSKLDEIVRIIDPHLLTVDIREAHVADDLEQAAATLGALRARGGRVCLEDIARGVSSLQLLRKLPIDEVRIGRHALESVTVHRADRAVVQMLVSLVRELGLDVSCDGIEHGAQADLLVSMGCLRQQGLHYTPALSTQQFDSYLRYGHAGASDLALGEVDWSSDQLIWKR